MRLWICIALLGAGCSQVPSGLGEEVPSGFSAERLYSTESVWRFELELSDEARAALFEEPREYVEGRFHFGNVTFERVGVRLKGAFSFQDLNGKAAFKIKFDEYDDQELYGLRNLTLNNLRQDRSQLHEFISYRVFRAFGVPAPRTGYAQLSINGVPYGLYANVESVDETFLRNNYTDGTGNLYEAPLGADLVSEDIELFEQDAGDDLTRNDLAQFAARVAVDGDAVFFADDTVLDSDRFLRFVAGEAATGHWDGYWKSNNYRIYHELEADLWTFIPWGLDQSLDRELDVFDGGGVLTKKCLALPSCLQAYANTGIELAAALEALNLPALVDEVAALIDDYVVSDPRLEHPPSMVRRHQASVRAMVERLPDRMLAAFDCLDEEGSPLDGDGDGFGACRMDCDDSSAAAHPGGTEICDGVDNDCDGAIDNLAECACDNAEFAGALFAFCENATQWTDAKALCAGKGGTLATPVSAEENQWMWDRAQALAAGSWYLGANDRLEEGAFTDADGETLDFTNWDEGQPDGFGPEHCGVLVEFGDGAWEDTRCTDLHPFICRLPE